MKLQIKVFIDWKRSRAQEVLVSTFVPWVRVTKVLPTFLTVNTDGALISYQSFFANGSALPNKKYGQSNRRPKKLQKQIKRKNAIKRGWTEDSRLLLATFLPLGNPLVLPGPHITANNYGAPLRKMQILHRQSIRWTARRREWGEIPDGHRWKEMKASRGGTEQ